MEQRQYKFDQVAVRISSGGFNLISKEEFLRKPVNERIELIMQGNVQFLNGGKIIPVNEALGRE